MSIYPTIKRPVTISENQIDVVLNSFRKESNQGKNFFLNDATGSLWQSLSQRIADEMEANMELSESAEEIAKAVISDCAGLNVARLGNNVYEISSEKTEAKTWLVEKESGEIFLYFHPNQFVDITEMGPETASTFVEKVFTAFNYVVQVKVLN